MGHIGPQNLDLLVPPLYYKSYMIARSWFQGKGHVLCTTVGRHNVYFAYCGIYSEQCTLVTYHFIKAHFIQLSTAVKAPHGLCLV